MRYSSGILHTPNDTFVWSFKRESSMHLCIVKCKLDFHSCFNNPGHLESMRMPHQATDLVNKQRSKNHAGSCG